MVATLALQCLSTEPRLRPNMDKVATALEKLHGVRKGSAVPLDSTLQGTSKTSNEPPLSEGSWEFISPKNHEKSGQPSSSIDSGERLQPMITKAAVPMFQGEIMEEMLEPAADIMRESAPRRIKDSNVPIANESNLQMIKFKDGDGSIVHPSSTLVTVPVSLGNSIQVMGEYSSTVQENISLENVKGNIMHENAPRRIEDSNVPIANESSSQMIKFKDADGSNVHPSSTTMTVPVSLGNSTQVMGETSTVQENISHENLDEDLRLISHCFLFPFGYEFTQDELVTLWIAEGLLQSDHNLKDRVEDVANAKFEALLDEKIIVESRTDQTLNFHNHKVRKLLYKLHESNVSSFKTAASGGGYVRVCDGVFDNVPKIVLHLSVLCKNIDDSAFKTIRKFEKLKSLFMISDFGTSIERVPRDIFLSLNELKTLNFSRSRVSEVPSSIGNLKAVRYIDLSYTPIKQLPNSIDTLQDLQTLKLRGCSNLIGLPNGMSKLTNLRHLDLDVIRQLKSMPPKMGKLTNLQTLSAFIVGREDGRKIGELKNAINLTGGFCISRLENVSKLEEAKEANLITKKFLKILELRWWNGKRVNSSSEEEKILEHLQPPLGIEQLRILNYGGSKLPTWISDRSYECLVEISLYNCQNCQLLPSMGKLPSLLFLHIKEMNELERIDHQFHRDNRDIDQQGHHAFPNLKTLTFEAMPKLEEWTGIESGDFPSLHKLQVKYCPKLKSLPSLSSFISLKHLEMSYCPNMQSFIEGEDDVSLEFLLIKNCPELTKRCRRSEGQDWGKIAHVPNILIDDEEISGQ